MTPALSGTAHVLEHGGTAESADPVYQAMGLSDTLVVLIGLMALATAVAVVAWWRERDA